MPEEESPLQAKREVLHSQPEQDESAPPPDAKARAWKEKNDWFGSDDEKTSFALGVHQKLVKSGVEPSSDEYYSKLNKRIAEVFPDKEKVEDVYDQRTSTVVAPVQRSPKSRKVVLTQTQVSLARRLGITPEQYARELVKTQERV